jgi:magnesium transporter
VRLFRPQSTAREVLDRLRAAPERQLQVVYVVDEQGRLVGGVPLQEVALADPEARLDALVRGLPARVQALAGRQEVIEEFETRRVPSLPVVDAEDRMLGVIRHATLVGQQEEAADLRRWSREPDGTLSPSPRGSAALLQVNLLTAFLAAAVGLEDTIARFTASRCCPVVAGQSGTLGPGARGDDARLAPREATAARRRRRTLPLRPTAAVAATTCRPRWSGSPACALIGLSMILSMTLAGLAGALIPMALTAARQDPAQASSIILTTVTDVVGFLSFLGIATALAGLLLAQGAGRRLSGLAHGEPGRSREISSASTSGGWSTCRG